MNTLLQKKTFKGRGSGRSILVVVALILINLISAIGVKAQTTPSAKLPYTNTSEWGNKLPIGWTAKFHGVAYEDVGDKATDNTQASSLIFGTANTTYNGSSSTNNYTSLTIQYDQVPGEITFTARVKRSTTASGSTTGSTSFAGGEFIVEQSTNGIDYNSLPIEKILDLPDDELGKKFSFQPHSSARVIRFRYAVQASDANADIALDNVSIKGKGISVSHNEQFYPTGENTPPYVFGKQEVGISSAPVAFTIANAGPDNLTIGNLIKDGAYVDDYVVTEPELKVLGPNESTTFTVAFKPSAAEPDDRTGFYILIPNSDVNKTPYRVNFSGIATAPQELSITSFSPGWGLAGTTVTINGTGFTSGFGLRFVSKNGGTVEAINKTYIGSTQVQVVVPEEATSGKLTMTDVGNQTTSSPEMFFVSANDPTPLPVEFLTFEGTSTSRGVQLKWQTASETNNEYFQLESATTFKADAFKPVMQVPSKVNNSNVVISYEALDTRPTVASTIYYRLKQVDFDGKFEYSKVIAVTNKATLAAEFKVKPNPVVENKVVVELPDATGGDLALTFTSMTGARALQQTTSVEANTHEKEVSLDSLAPGLYIVTIEYNNQVSHQRVLKK